MEQQDAIVKQLAEIDYTLAEIHNAVCGVCLAVDRLSQIALLVVNNIIVPEDVKAVSWKDPEDYSSNHEE